MCAAFLCSRIGPLAWRAPSLWRRVLPLVEDPADKIKAPAHGGFRRNRTRVRGWGLQAPSAFSILKVIDSSAFFATIQTGPWSIA
jgi:hypothetical protein